MLFGTTCRHVLLLISTCSCIIVIVLESSYYTLDHHNVSYNIHDCMIVGYVGHCIVYMLVLLEFDTLEHNAYVGHAFAA